MFFSQALVWRSLLASLTIGLTTLDTLSSVSATPFAHQESDQNRFVAFAVPYRIDSYNLFVVEQLSNSQACWSERGSNPTQIEPLLLNFDFTGICGRNDSNGYSIRLEGQDLSWQYNLTLVKRNDEIVLLGTPIDNKAATLEIGRSYGISNGYTKIILNPGWRFTKRVYNGQTLGHIYFTQGSVSAVTPIQPVQASDDPGL